MNIAVYGTRVANEFDECLETLQNLVNKYNIGVFIYDKFYNDLQKKYEISSSFQKFSYTIDLKENNIKQFYSFGGDGTILSAITLVKELDIPIIGINTGRLGFLTTIQKSEFKNKAEDFITEKYKVSERLLLEVQAKSSLDFPYALNEISFFRKETTSMITIDAFVNHEYLNTFWADGLIVATPTGSTAYSLSCGGPIITPENSNIIISPIAPHNLNVRPVVLRSNCEIKLKISSRVSTYSLSLDSRLFTFPIEEEIIIKKANFSIKIAFLQDYSYYETLREKLFWGFDTRNTSK